MYEYKTARRVETYVVVMLPQLLPGEENAVLDTSLWVYAVD